MSETPENPEDRETTGQIIHNVLIPEDSVATSVVEIVEYLDEDCERAYAFRFTGSSSVATILGLLDLAKQNVLAAAEFP